MYVIYYQTHLKCQDLFLLRVKKKCFRWILSLKMTYRTFSKMPTFDPKPLSYVLRYNFQFILFLFRLFNLVFDMKDDRKTTLKIIGLGSYFEEDIELFIPVIQHILITPSHSLMLKSYLSP